MNGVLVMVAFLLLGILVVLEAYRQYRSGYEEGLDAGLKAGKEEGFKEGRRVGYNKGFKEGYQMYKDNQLREEFVQAVSETKLGIDRKKALDEAFSRAKRFMSEPYENNVILKVEKIDHINTETAQN